MLGRGSKRGRRKEGARKNEHRKALGREERRRYLRRRSKMGRGERWWQARIILLMCQ